MFKWLDIMNNTIINKDLLMKVISFLKKSNSLNNLDPNIFATIDGYRENSDVDFNSYYLEYIGSLPKLDFETAVKISKEVYQMYGKENDFDKILEGLLNNHCIDYGSLNKDDDNCLTRASESRILLSGTYYDVVLLCHEVGHKLRNNNDIHQSDIMDTFFFETPSIMLEFAANDYLRDVYGVDIGADELRKKHVSSIKKEDNTENSVFLSVMRLLRERKLNAVNLYVEFIRNRNMTEYLNRQGVSIENCVDEGMSNYSYIIGYILGEYIRNSNNRSEILNMVLNYKDNGINAPFTIDPRVINEALAPLNQNVTQENNLSNEKVKKLVKTTNSRMAFINYSLMILMISIFTIFIAITILIIDRK